MSAAGTVRISFLSAVVLVAAAALAGCTDGPQAENKVPELTFDGDLVRGSEVTMVLDGLGGLRATPVTIEIFGEDRTADARFTGAVVPEAGILRFGFYLPSRLTKDKVCDTEGRCQRPVLAVGKHRIKVSDAANSQMVLKDTTFDVVTARAGSRYPVRMLDSCNLAAVDFDGRFWLPAQKPTFHASGGSTLGELTVVDATHARFAPPGAPAVDLTSADDVTAAGLGC